MPSKQQIKLTSLSSFTAFLILIFLLLPFKNTCGQCYRNLSKIFHFEWLIDININKSVVYLTSLSVCLSKPTQRFQSRTLLSVFIRFDYSGKYIYVFGIRFKCYLHNKSNVPLTGSWKFCVVQRQNHHLDKYLDYHT